MKYIKLFSNHSVFAEYSLSLDHTNTPNVSYCIVEKHVHYNPLLPPHHDYSQDYLTIESLEDNNTISFKTTNGNLAKMIGVSTDNGSTWINKTSTKSGVILATLNTGDKLLIKGSNITYGVAAHYNYFVSTGEFNVSGNIMSLIYSDNFSNKTSFPPYNSDEYDEYEFKYLFLNCTKLISAENLILPVTTLTKNCYEYMFYSCTSLMTAPELPATTLAQSCYIGMFNNCTSLVTAPELPATTLVDGCYYRMFEGCTSLTTTPELPVTILASSCYRNMFKGCTNLSSIKCLATDISASGCTQNWVSGVAASGTFTKAASMSSWTEDVNGIPSGWTVQDAA